MSEKGPENEQRAYELGYDNPSRSSREWTWRHVVLVNAYWCGQADAQSHAPRNPAYSPADYDFPTCERKPPRRQPSDVRSFRGGRQ